ncbi:MAG: tetratricopeptide repeat protein [bacterium]|nr:tetratricopeptide repeat protein [bacterium]
MSDENRDFERIDAVLSAALDRPVEEREAFLDRECAGDAGLRRRVESLLHAVDDPHHPLVPGGALEGPLWESVVDDLRESPALPAGSRLGPYEIVALIGEGGAGQVYRATDVRLRRAVAVKVLARDRWGPDQEKRFGREARAASALNHPGIVTIYDVGQADGASYIAMELVDGESLRERMDRTPLDLGEALSVACRVAEALSIAHAKGIAHRDLKPGNIMLTSQGEAKIVDFGLAKVGVDAGADATFTENEPHTAEGTVFGTVGYMAPEQARGAATDHRADMFSFGAILYEMLTGRRAFGRASHAETIAAILKEEPAPIAPQNTEVPVPLHWAVERCLRKDPAERYDSTRDLARDLEAVRRYVAQSSVSRVQCEKCHSENPHGHRFCSQCGADLRRACATCGEILSLDAGFCGACGKPLPSASFEAEVTSRPALESERRKATILIVRLIGFESAIEELPSEALEEHHAFFEQLARETVERFGGTIDRSDPEQVVALFGVPTAHEDDPARAARAALEIHAGLDTRGGPTAEIRPCSAVHTGMIVVRTASEPGRRRRIVGEAAEVAMSLAHAGAPGQVLLTPESRRLAGSSIRTEPLEKTRIRGGSEPIVPHRAMGTDDGSIPPLQASGAPLTAFAGRQSELGTLLGCVEAAVGGEGQFVAVLGEAGAGKSRLFFEMRRQVDRERVVLLEGRCQSHGERVPYLPLIQVCRAALGVKDEQGEDAQLESMARRVHEIDPELEAFLPLYVKLLSLPNDRHPLPEHLEGKLFRHAMQEAIAALLTLASREKPLLLLLEDWHWVDEASHDAVRQLIEMCPGYPVMLAVSHRPEASPDWGSFPPRTVQLAALGPVSAGAIIRSVLGAQSLPDDLTKLIHHRTAGNPFFLEETCRALIEDGTLELVDGTANVNGPLERLQLPDSVQAVIRTRLDRIDDVARDLLRHASVIGREFSLDVLQSSMEVSGELDAMLERLKERGLVRRVRVVPETVYAFQHVLTQEVAYDSLLQIQRQELHGRVGRALETLHGQRLEEHYDELSRHFAEAMDWPRAVEYGHCSAQRARSLSQFTEALDTLERTRRWVERLEDGAAQNEEWIKLLQEESRVSEIVGDRRRHQRAVDDLLQRLEPLGDRPELVQAYTGRAELLALAKRFDAGEQALEQALSCSRRLEDPELERHALRSLAFLYWQRGRNEDALASLDSALAIDRASGDKQRLAGTLTNRASALRGLGRHEEALQCLHEALELAEGPGSNPHRLTEANYVVYTIYRDLGQTEKGESFLRRAIEIQSADRFTIHQPFHAGALATVLLGRGEVEEGLKLLRTQVEKCRRSQYAFGLSRCQQSLAETLLGLGRDDEALPHLLEAARVFRRLREHDVELDMLCKAGPILEREGAETRGAWERALEVARAERDDEATIVALKGLARAAESVGMNVQALGYLQDARTRCPHRDHALRGELLNSIGILEWKDGEFDRALAAFEAALECFETEEDRVHAGLALNSIGACLKSLGRRREAFDILERAVRVHVSSGQTLLRGHALALLGDIAFEQGDLERASARYQESMKIREEIGDRRGEGWMRHHLARTFATAGERDRARESAMLARAAAESVDDEELQRACDELGLD